MACLLHQRGRMGVNIFFLCLQVDLPACYNRWRVRIGQIWYAILSITGSKSLSRGVIFFCVCVSVCFSAAFICVDVRRERALYTLDTFHFIRFDCFLVFVFRAFKFRAIVDIYITSRIDCVYSACYAFCSNADLLLFNIF